MFENGHFSFMYEGEKRTSADAFPADVITHFFFGGEKRQPEIRLRSQATDKVVYF